MSDTRIARARLRLEERWHDSGECRSCGWHAALYEHDVTDEQIREALDKNDGVLRLGCYSDEPDGHRGVRIFIGEELTGEKT